MHQHAPIRTVSRALLLLGVLGSFAILGSPGAALDKPPLERLPKPARASGEKPPPSRPCPESAPDCLDVSKYLTLNQFMNWARGDVSGMWSDTFAAGKMRYRAPRYRQIGGGGTALTRCNGGERVRSLAGPFYCSADGRNGTVFMPMVGLQRLIFPDGNWKAQDFAITYVVAHEWGHHVQYSLGLLSARRSSRSIELEADCLAGVWAYSAWDRGLLSPGDISEAIRLARLIGDAPGTSPTAPESHGTGPQRVAAFNKGYRSGKSGRC
jgi:uncharacterized protein